MKVSINTTPCARAEDMVTYLYNEASSDEAKDFESHLQNCSSCCSELATFGDVREAMGEWRQQALGSTTSPALEANAARRFAPAAAPERRRSALGALREFFILSPTWMRAATAVGAVLFCALAAISVAYFVRQPQTPIAQRQVESSYSEKEVEEKIAAAIKKYESQVKDAAPEGVKIASGEQPKVNAQIKRNTSGALQLAKNSRRRRVAPHGIIPSSKMELASFLPFTAPGEEEKLPSLTDLVDEDN